MTVQTHIEKTLTEQFSPSFLAVDNESHLHASGKGTDSHFKITMVTDAFEGLGLVARHRAVQGVIKPHTVAVHALGLHTYTPAEWQARGGEAPDSPSCAGGSR